MKRTPLQYRDLGQIIMENANELAKIGQAMQSDYYAAIPVSFCKHKLGYDEALEAVNKSTEPMCIVRVMYTAEKGQKFGIVRHASSRLYGKRVIIGRENSNGLVRCSDVERKSNIDYIHKSFIKML